METKKYENLAPVFLRLIIGFGFLAHGWAKISHGTQGFEKLLEFTHVPFPHLTSWIVPLIELAGGLAILTGTLTSLFAIPLICTMLVAMITIQFKFGFSSVKTIGLISTGPLFGPPGYEINLLYIAGLISLILTGPGFLSVDQFIFRKESKALS